MVVDLTFKTLIHFELIFVYGMRKYFSFILLHIVTLPDFPFTSYFRENIFFPLYGLASFVID